MSTQDNVKGLAIAKDFFLKWGLPFLEKEFPYLVGHMAAGRFSGSDVLGADDQISSDHNWGPQFSLFLSEEDYDNHAEALSERMNGSAPKRWQGYWFDGAGDKNVLVENVPYWIERQIGFTKPPQSDQEWGVIVRDRRVGGSVETRESALYYLKHGALWLDNNKEFAQWRKALEKYPEEVWFARLGEECFRLWQYGEYNFLQRIAKRGDPIAIAMCLGEFAEGVMHMMLLLQREYTPYWKWLTREFRGLERGAHYAPLLESLLRSTDAAEQSELVAQICHDVHQELLALGVVSGRGEYQTMPLFNAHHELMAKATWMPSLS
jgi:hypothetical protein